MLTPELILRTRFVLDEYGRIRSTREPGPSPGPFFTLIRSASSCAWAVRADVTGDIAAKLVRLAHEEQPTQNAHATPLHASTYLSLVGGQLISGPTFTFPDEIAQPGDVTTVNALHLLER